MVESVPLVVSGAGRTIDSLVLERLDYRLATEEEREKIPDKSTEKHLALAYYDTLTGMFTRQGFFIHARGLLETFKARDEDFVLIQMNVRHFRIIKGKSSSCASGGTDSLDKTQRIHCRPRGGRCICRGDAKA